MTEETVLSVMKDVRDLLRKFGVEMAPDETPVKAFEPVETKRFVDQGDGTILDTWTLAVHLQDTRGTIWNKPMTWDDAVEKAAQWTFAGQNDWRLPTALEEFAIMDGSVKNGAMINPIFKGQKPGWYWTSTDYVPATTYAMIVGFNTGFVSVGTETGAYCVRPVRGGRG